MMRTLMVLLLAAACGDDFSDAPVATIVSATPDALVADDDGADDITLVVHYQDGDGDLGGGTAEIADCRRASVVTVVPLPEIASPDAVESGVMIEGDLELLVADVGLVDPDATVPPACADLGVTAIPASGEVVLCVTLVDAAGNRGDGDCTGAISIE